MDGGKSKNAAWQASILAAAVTALAGCGRVDFTPVYGADTAPHCDPLHFDVPVIVENINTAAYEFGSAIRGDDLEIYFHSARPGGQGADDIWRAVRPGPGQPFGAPGPAISL